MKDLALKLIALLLAGVLWFFVSAPRRERVRERLVTASISLVSVPPHLVITTTIPSGVAVRVRGRMSELRALASQTLEAAVDLSMIREAGEVEITLRPQHFNVPQDIEVVSIDPNKFRFTVEQIKERTVEVRPFLVGNPPVGYTVGDPTATPDRALVSGPASQVAKLREVTTERIIMTGRTSTFVQDVAVVSDSPLVRVISPAMTQVMVPVLAEIGPAAPPTATDTAATDTATTTAPAREEDEEREPE